MQARSTIVLAYVLRCDHLFKNMQLSLSRSCVNAMLRDLLVLHA